MDNLFSTGRSAEPSSKLAATQAAEQARAGQAGRSTQLALVFAGPAHDFGAALAATAATFPGATVAGCSTAGELTADGLSHGGLVVAALAGDLQVTGVLADGVGKDPSSASETLTAGLARQTETARAGGRPFVSMIGLVDGLNGAGERLVQAISQHAEAGTRILGGAAGDEGAFKETRVGLGARTASDAAVLLNLFGRSPVGVGMGHGLRPATPPLTITRAEGNTVHEIAGRPAFEIYRDHARAKGIDLTPESAGAYMITYELGLFLFGELWEARAPLKANADGSLMCAGDLAVGQKVSILEGSVDQMVAAARAAAKEAKEGLRGVKPAGVIVFDCICRGILLKDSFAQEIAAIRSELGEVPIAGFLTYGEIARYGGSSSSWHNTTAVVVALPS